MPKMIIFKRHDAWNSSNFALFDSRSTALFKFFAFFVTFGTFNRDRYELFENCQKL